MPETLSPKQNFLKGIVKENPVFVMLLGMCPTLGVTTSAFNGLGMGLATLFVLLMSNIVVSLIKSQVPAKVRIPAFIVIIAAFVTVAEMVLEAYIPFLYEQLGIFIPLIVVNCLILGRAEAFASKNNLAVSIVDALGMGAGFVIALTALGATRELLGNGSLFEFRLVPEDASTLILFILPPGAFIALAYLAILFNKLTRKLT
jgi:electron transport complex protein RnfE